MSVSFLCYCLSFLFVCKFDVKSFLHAFVSIDFLCMCLLCHLTITSLSCWYGFTDFVPLAYTLCVWGGGGGGEWVGVRETETERQTHRERQTEIWIDIGINIYTYTNVPIPKMPQDETIHFLHILLFTFIEHSSIVQCVWTCHYNWCILFPVWKCKRYLHFIVADYLQEFFFPDDSSLQWSPQKVKAHGRYLPET